MPLSVGEKIGPYEILALIGKGGMGEVYRARDPRLNRDVAIKISNAQFTERFTREARAIAALRGSDTIAIRLGGVGSCGYWLHRSPVAGGVDVAAPSAAP